MNVKVVLGALASGRKKGRVGDCAFVLRADAKCECDIHIPGFVGILDGH
jgi:hypothetical protein